MLLQHFPHGERLAVFAVRLVQRGHIGRRRGHRRGQDIFQQVLSANRRRSARGVRRDGEHAGLAQQPEAILIGEFYAPEVAPVDTGNSVMARQLFIEKGLIRRQQVEDAVVLFQLSVEEQLRLGHERGTEVVVKPGKLGAIRIEQPYVTNLQPIFKEILDQRGARAGIGEHARNLLLEHRRLMQLAANGQVQQSVVRNTAPQGERQSRSQLDIGDAIDASPEQRPRDRPRCGTENPGSPARAPAPSESRRRSFRPRAPRL